PEPTPPSGVRPSEPPARPHRPALPRPSPPAPHIAARCRPPALDGSGDESGPFFTFAVQCLAGRSTPAAPRRRLPGNHTTRGEHPHRDGRIMDSTWHPPSNPSMIDSLLYRLSRSA